jgi:hypothetical protein
MSSPSDKNLTRAFPNLDYGKAEELSDKLKEALGSEDDDAIDKALEFANEALGGHGVEAIQGDGTHIDNYWRDTVLVYVNLGDTYDTTILYDTENEEFSIGSWGDFMEEWEKDGEDEDSATKADEDEEEEEEGDDEDEEDEEETSDSEENVEEAGE